MPVAQRSPTKWDDAHEEESADLFIHSRDLEQPSSSQEANILIVFFASVNWTLQ